MMGEKKKERKRKPEDREAFEEDKERRGEKIRWKKKRKNREVFEEDEKKRVEKRKKEKEP